jgi:hypothetical protein
MYMKTDKFCSAVSVYCAGGCEVEIAGGGGQHLQAEAEGVGENMRKNRTEQGKQ